MKVTVKQRNYFFISMVFILVFVCGCYVDIKPLLDKYHEANKVKQTLCDAIYSANQLLSRRSAMQTEWRQLQKKLQSCLRIENNTLVASELLSVVLHAAETNGLQVNSIEPGVWQKKAGVSSLSMHLFIHGRFLQFVEFVSMLKQYALPIEIADYNLHADLNGELEIDLQLIGSYIATHYAFIAIPVIWSTPANIDLFLQRDPFVSSSEKIIELDNRNIDNNMLLQTVFLRQIKWVGYVANHKKFWALAKLPNGKTVEVTYHSILGLEHARVLELSNQNIRVDLSGHQIRLSYQQ